MSRAIQEHDYIGVSGVSSIKQTSVKPKSAPTKTTNLSKKPTKSLTTELRLGLPGSESPESGVVDGDNGVNFSLGVVKILGSGTKRAFSDAINGSSNTWVLPKNGGSEMGSLKNAVSLSSSVLGDDMKLHNSPGSGQSAPAEAPSKAQVIGWPPVRSFRKNSMAVNTPTNNEEKDCMYIKVSLDGAPYLRKVDIKTYGSYVELSTVLEKMFSGFTIGQLGNHGEPDQGGFEQGRLADNLQRSEYVLTYEDKDGDWMLVGDVPWNMFMDSCQRLRIIKSSDAVGLGSGATEK